MPDLRSPIQIQAQQPCRHVLDDPINHKQVPSPRVELGLRQWG